MIVQMKSGRVDLEKILTPEQERFYRTHRNFSIHKLFAPQKGKSVVVSFDEEIYNASYFKHELIEGFIIYFQWGFYDYIRQKKVNVHILNNHDIIVSTNLKREFNGDIEPLREELTHFIILGQQKFEKSIQNSNLYAIYIHEYSEQFHEIMFSIAFKYRMFTDNWLNEHFFYEVFKQHFSIRSLFLHTFRREKIQLSRRYRINITYAIHVVFTQFYKDEISKRDSRFAFQFVEHVMTLQTFGRLFSQVNALESVLRCRAIIYEIVDTLHLNEIFRTFAFEIARKARLPGDISPELMAICSVTITSIILNYYKRIKRALLARKYDLKYPTVQANMKKFLEYYGYQPKGVSIYETEENREKFMKFVKKDLQVNYDTFEVHLLLAKELFQVIKTNKRYAKFTPLIEHLITTIDNAYIKGFKILTKISQEEKKELVKFLLNTAKRWRGLGKKSGYGIVIPIEKLIKRLDVDVSLSFLFKEGILS